MFISTLVDWWGSSIYRHRIWHISINQYPGSSSSHTFTQLLESYMIVSIHIYIKYITTRGHARIMKCVNAPWLEISRTFFEKSIELWYLGSQRDKNINIRELDNVQHLWYRWLNSLSKRWPFIQVSYQSKFTDEYDTQLLEYSLDPTVLPSITPTKFSKSRMLWAMRPVRNSSNQFTAHLTEMFQTLTI